MAAVKRQSLTVQQEHFKTAQAFMRALHPSNRRWGDRHGAWVFRGHGNAKWKLLPTVMRPGALKAFDAQSPELSALPEGARAAFELGLLRRFGEGLERRALGAPGTSRALLELVRAETPDIVNWPRRHAELAALAQHNRIPTRLLDFSESPLVAAYFAAQEPGDNAEHLCVWALGAHVIVPDARSGRLWLGRVRATRASNPNLHAQEGLFVTWTGFEKIVPLDAVVRELADGDGFALPANRTRPIRMRQLLLPRDCSAELLRLLTFERISGATMFPGVEGVVLEMKEEGVHRMFRNPT